jgi:GGDEF domain-containing protein
VLGKLRKKETVDAPQAVWGEQDTDSETGLMAPPRFEEAIEKEIARALRYGSKSALALFEVDVAEQPADGPLPSPARFVAKVLRDAARTSDIVARVSPRLFAVLLVEAEVAGAQQFTERVRTRIGSDPYARKADGTALFARAWAGVAPWEPGIDSVEKYAHAAERSLASTFRGYEAAQDWFKSEGLNKPLAL